MSHAPDTAAHRTATTEVESSAGTESTNPEDPAALKAYRQSLIDAEKQGQDSFDKTVLSLSGGALGISFVFIKDVIGPDPIIQPELLLAAWILWSLSTLAILVSFYTSNRALRKAIEQCDKGTIYCEPPGGFFSQLTRRLNVAGIACLIFGIGFMTAFVYLNLAQRGTTNGKVEEAVTTATAPDTSAASNSATRATTTEGHSETN